MAETVRGYLLLGSLLTPRAPMTRAGRVILVDRAGVDKVECLDRYVTAWQGESEDGLSYDRSWCNGHYFKTWEEAVKDFADRCKRGS